MRRMEIHRHTKEIITLTVLLALPSLVFAADEAPKPKIGSKSAIIISNKIDLKKITPGKPFSAGNKSASAAASGASAPIVVDKDAMVIKGKRGNVIMTSPKK